MTPEKQKEWEDWLETRPESVQRLARKYPPGKYRIKPGAPYGVSCPGTTVYIHGYTEDGEVIVLILAIDKLPEAIDHEIIVGKSHGRTDQELEEIHAMDIKTYIDPKWIELIENVLENDENI